MRSAAATADRAQQTGADVSPVTERERVKAAEERLDRRTERFIDDMYLQPVFSPLMLLLTIIGLGGFLITWGYFVAKPVVDAHRGATGTETGSDAGDLG